jgi:hypothetical protein
MTTSSKVAAFHYLTKNYWGFELFSALQSILWGVLFWSGNELIRGNPGLGPWLGLFFGVSGLLQFLILFWKPAFRTTFSLLGVFKWGVLALFLFQERGINYECATALMLSILSGAANISNGLRGMQGRAP